MTMNCLKIIIRRASTFKKTVKILKHFEESHRYEVSPAVTQLRSSVVNGLKNFQSTAKLDMMLCSNLKHLNTEGFLSILNSWCSTRPDVLHSTVFYQAFLTVVRKGLWKTVPLNHLVEIIHFVGYLNGDADSKNLMILLLNSVNGSLELPYAHYKDICIVCEAAFRTSTGISSPGIRGKIIDILENLTDDVTDDSVWLVMLIKMMIFSKFHDVALLEQLAETWLKSGRANKMPFTAQCYVMSLFAHAGVKHGRLFDAFIQSIVAKMERRAEGYRVKDVSMFLWAVSSLSFSINPHFLNHVINPFLETQLDGRNLSEGLNIMIQCCMSLWMLGSINKPLLDHIITMESLKILQEKSKNYRDLSRLAQLLSILEAEYPNSMTSEQRSVQNVLSKTKLLVPNLQKEVAKRPGLQQLSAILENVGFCNVRLEYPVQIYVAGVTAELNRQLFHVDLLDHTTCIATATEPIGRLLAKTRLLKLRFPSMGHATVTGEDLGKMQSLEKWQKLLSIRRIG